MSSRLRKFRLAADREHRRREAEAAIIKRRAWSLEAYSRGTNGKLHAAQFRATTDRARNKLLMCSRRAGKTAGIAGEYADGSVTKPGGNRAYIALTKDQARGIMWDPLWKPLCDKWGLCSPDAHNETRMVTTFPNGSTVRFTGSDDIRHIKTELGAALDAVCIDESQDQPDDVLRELADKILPPALGDRRGTLTISGVFPDVQAGYYWDTRESGAWSNHNWSMFDNPHFDDPQGVVDDYLAKHPGLTIDDPMIQRDYYGRGVYDAKATAYRYLRSLNGYAPTVPDWLDGERAALERAGIPIATLMAALAMEGIDLFSAALDPGAIDRAALVVLGWGRRSRKVQQVFEWSTPRKAHASWSQMGAVCGLVQRRFAPTWWHYDAGSSTNELDLFARDHGIPVIKAATKADFPGQVRRNSDLLLQGRLLVIEGGALEEDYQKARLDPVARARGKWQWSSQHHPDPSEAGRYALNPYWDTWEEPDARTPAERELAAADMDPDLLNDGELPPDPMSQAIGWR